MSAVEKDGDSSCFLKSSGQYCHSHGPSGTFHRRLTEVLLAVWREAGGPSCLIIILWVSVAEVCQEPSFCTVDGVAAGVEFLGSPTLGCQCPLKDNKVRDHSMSTGLN